MVHVLRQIHKALKPDGVLLDVHPLPKAPPLEVWRGEDRTLVDYLDWEHAIELIENARRVLNSVVDEGLFTRRARRFFDLHETFPSVDAWLEHRREFDEQGAIRRDLLASARREMRKPGGTLVITERIRATVLGKQ